MSVSFVVLIPVKPTALAKSRLLGLADQQRQSLALAFALDTLDAALAATPVVGAVVITDDQRIATHARARGCRVVPDAGELNASLVAGAGEAARHWPGARPVALCGDLPALRAAELADALALVPDDGPAFVADAEAAGTTLYTAPYELFAPSFGPRSAAAHRALGAVLLDGAGAGLRGDVDDRAALDHAEALGLGPHTTAALAAQTKVAGP